MYKSPGRDQIPTKMIHSIWNEEELPDQLKQSIIVPLHKKVIKLTVIIIKGYH
jgi:hypothetical protein